MPRCNNYQLTGLRDKKRCGGSKFGKCSLPPATLQRRERLINAPPNTTQKASQRRHTINASLLPTQNNDAIVRKAIQGRDPTSCWMELSECNPNDNLKDFLPLFNFVCAERYFTPVHSTRRTKSAKIKEEKNFLSPLIQREGSWMEGLEHVREVGGWLLGAGWS